MDVNCPACAARYKADEQKLRGKTARMRCRACDTVWLVSGPAAEIKTSTSKQAAVVKRGAEREHRDLFATRPPDLGSSRETPVKQTLRPPHPDSKLSGMAARNETSVLFTVDALRGSARLNTPAAERSTVSGLIMEDDEGIIDLNALASTPPSRIGNRSVAPLFASEPPPAAFAADVYSGAGPAFSAGGFRFGKRAIAGVAAAAVALVLCVVGVAAAFKGEEPTARAAANTMVAQPPVLAAPAAVPTAPATPAVPAMPAAAASASNDDDAKPAHAVGKKKGRKGAAKSSLATQKVQSSGVAKTVPKAADKCGCKGDFNCILRCTATGK